jgi:uncharacterized protein (DUF2141 family)
LRSRGGLSVLSAFIIFSGLSLVHCARIGSPTGGPKDEDPPEVIGEMPANHTVFFNSKNAAITFSEFVQLKDASKEIFISPPMRMKPEYKVQGKKIVIEFQEELKENATYTINFGNSIVDFTESNPLVNYEYVFSTGSHIDSLSIPGKILNAYTHDPEKEIIAMVYQDDNDTILLDSLPMRVPPKSASKTTKDGSFRINNLAAGEYKLFALEDLNNNYIFDLPNERIAFLDSLITINPPETDSVVPFPADTALTDTVLTDTVLTDTVPAPAPSVSLSLETPYTLYLFQEEDTTQKLLSKKLIGSSLLQYIFQRPADSVRIAPVGFDPGRPDWYLQETSKRKDTINFWLRYGLPDTLRVCIREGDSLADTSRFILSKGAAEKTGKRKEGPVRTMGMTTNLFGGYLDLNKDLRINFAIPVEDFDPLKINLYTPTDTLIPGFTFSDSLRKSGTIMHKWIPDEFCQLKIEDSAFCDIGGNYSDSLAVRFKLRTAESYGVLIMNIALPEMPGRKIIQLMTDKNVVVAEKTLTGPGLVRFDYLMPGNYKLNAIFDRNSNGKWDTGNYGKNSLPERVEYYPSLLNIRANWDLQEDWQLE